MFINSLFNLTTMIRFQKYFVIQVLICCLFWGCKQEIIRGLKASGNEPFKVYFLNGKDKGVLNAVVATAMTIDVNSKTVNFPVQIFRGGQAGSEPFTVNVSVDNAVIPSLIQSGHLPANTVVPDANSYTIDEKVTLSVVHDMMKGSVEPKFKIDNLNQYVGKNIAIGLKLQGTSRYTIDEEMDNVVMFFEVNSLAGPIRFLASEHGNNGIVNVLKSSFSVNSADNTVNTPIDVVRPGSVYLGGFTVDATVDNSMIEGMVQSGDLPANTIVLSTADYSFDTKVTLSKSGDLVTGNLLPKIKIANLNQYSGKKAVLGFRINNPSQFAIDPNRDKAVLYFDVDSLLDETVPPTNLLSPSSWTVFRINNDDKVVFTVNADGSIKAAGGNGGHAGVYQPVQVKAGRKYKIDMHVKGSGATDVWYEVYVGTVAPTPGSDYSNGGIKLALNTWTGCGKTPFDGLLSAIACVNSNKGVFTASATGTMYVVIKSGGNNLGTEGITASDIDFRRVQ
ncbi:MAG: DUF1735 domain-containing protein [Niabella sp.]